MGTSYKALLRAFVITSPTFHPPIVVSLVGNLATALSCFTREVRTETLALFICYGLTWKGYPYLPVILCFTTSGVLTIGRRTFEFNDFSPSATRRSDSYGFAAKGIPTNKIPKRFSRSLHAALGSGSCVFPEFFSLLVGVAYCCLLNCQVIRY